MRRTGGFGTAMPVDRSVRLSVMELCALLELSAARFVDVEVDRQSSMVTIVQEPKDPQPVTCGPDPTGHP